jgi:hypothetical protein
MSNVYLRVSIVEDNCYQTFCDGKWVSVRLNFWIQDVLNVAKLDWVHESFIIYTPVDKADTSGGSSPDYKYYKIFYPKFVGLNGKKLYGLADRFSLESVDDE